MATKHLKNFDEVVDVLGGLEAIADLLDTTESTVGVWRTDRGLFPAQHVVTINSALGKYHCSAPWLLFDFDGHPRHPVKTKRVRWSEERRQKILDGGSRKKRRR